MHTFLKRLAALAIATIVITPSIAGAAELSAAQRSGRIFARMEKFLNLAIHNPSLQKQESDRSSRSGARVPELHPECHGRYSAIPEFGQFRAETMASSNSIRRVIHCLRGLHLFFGEDASAVVTLPGGGC